MKDPTRLPDDLPVPVSTQDTPHQQEAAQRLDLPYALLSDEHLQFARALDLPTFEADGVTLLKRLTMFIADGRIEDVLNPVFPPDRSASDALLKLAALR